jgi:hypothetical protein
MATFNVTIGAYVNQAPSQLGNNTINIDFNETFVFTSSIFTDTTPAYSDPEGDAPSLVKITSLPTYNLILSATPVILNQEITIADIVAGNLSYTGDISETAGYSDTFTFDIADVGSSTFAGLTGNIFINAGEAINLPPSEVGDGAATVDYGETLVFTSAMFTTSTVPIYADPEGDNPQAVKILTLPNLGIIYYNGIPVTANQIIQVGDIDAGLLTYTPDNADTDGDVQGFTFAVSDVGSGEFVE